MLRLSTGQIVADKYRMDAVVGAGGMGVVVAATHVELGQRVAIKLLRDVTPEAQARFAREARLLVRLKSPHVARVFDVGSLDDETPYIVMELLEGSDLGKILETRGRLATEEASDFVLQACCAVAEAHTLGMVHRDLKPANLFLAAGPGGATLVKVLDFGVSKMLDMRPDGVPPGDLTNEGVALGSPGYMAPEQINNSRDVDVRADIYSLGAILYRLVSGQNPYKGNSVVSILAAMAVDRLPPLRSLVPEAPEGFAAAVERCLAQERGARWASVAELGQALAPFAGRRGRAALDEILATVGSPRGSSPATTDPSLGAVARAALEGPQTPMMETLVRPASLSARAAPPSPPVDPTPRRGSATVFAAAGVLLLGAAALAYALVSRDGARPPRDRAGSSAEPSASASSAPSSPTPTPSAPSSTSTSGGESAAVSSDLPPKPSSHPKPRPPPPPPRHVPSVGPAEVPPDRH